MVHKVWPVKPTVLAPPGNLLERQSVRLLPYLQKLQGGAGSPPGDPGSSVKFKNLWLRIYSKHKTKHTWWFPKFENKWKALTHLFSGFRLPLKASHGSLRPLCRPAYIRSTGRRTRHQYFFKKMYLPRCFIRIEQLWCFIQSFFKKMMTQIGASSSVVKNPPANAGDLGLILESERSPGEGNGNPLQYSRLENPMDRGAWPTTVQGVAESQTRLRTRAHMIEICGLCSLFFAPNTWNTNIPLKMVSVLFWKL